MMRVRWPQWRAAPAEARAEVLAEAARTLDGMSNSAVYSLLGHKGDLMLVHFRKSFEELHQAEMELLRLRFSDFLEPASSYLSMIELGLYESTAKVYADLAAKGVEPYSEEWKREINEVLDRSRQAMAPRLWPDISHSS